MELIIAFREDIMNTKNFIKKVKHYLPKGFWKIARTEIDQIKIDPTLNFVRLQKDHLEKLEYTLFLVREKLKMQFLKKQSADITLNNLMRFRFTYVIFSDCILLDESFLEEISEEDRQYILDDNQKCHELMKPYIIISKSLFEKYSN